MTVEELICELQQFDSAAEVYFHDSLHGSITHAIRIEKSERDPGEQKDSVYVILD